MRQEEHKFCKDCLVEKPAGEFYSQNRTLKDGSVVSYLQSYCKVCHKVRMKEPTLRWQSKNPDVVRKNARLWKSKNKDRVASHAATRRASKINATPPWLTSQHNRQITEFYWLAKDVSAVSEQPYHVDHIVPLTSEHVCGLHVPWNLQILPADLNVGKSNKFDCWWID